MGGRNGIRCSAFLIFTVTSLLFLSLVSSKVSIPDELDDVLDDEEDEAWREWGKKKKSPPSSPDFDPSKIDFSKVAPDEIQREMLERHTGPTFGFVKLRLGVPRSSDEVVGIATRWSKLLKTGSIDVNFMAVDRSTIMFTLERGQSTIELKDFILGQYDAYEVKIGDQLFRRPGDPPVEEVLEKLHKEKEEADGRCSNDEL